MDNIFSFQNLLSIIRNRSVNTSRFVIAISGFGGSGKSTIAKQLAEELNNCELIPLDHFIINQLFERSEDWNGFDWNRLIEQVLLPIKEDKETISYDVYNWNENKITGVRTLDFPKYIIIEGIGLLREELKPYFSFSVWIDVPLHEAINRGKKRDKEKYNVNHDELWDNTWGPNDYDYYNKHKPRLLADYILKI